MCVNYGGEIYGIEKDEPRCNGAAGGCYMEFKNRTPMVRGVLIGSWQLVRKWKVKEQMRRLGEM